jgi:hypothetical protein
MDSVDGFKFACPIKTENKSVNRYGIVDEILTSVGPASCRFTPAGMTNAIWMTLAPIDGTTIKLPGSTASTTDLVVSGTGLSVTMAKATCEACKLGFGTSKDRFGELVFHSRTVFTAGIPAKLLTITGPA